MSVGKVDIFKNIGQLVTVSSYPEFELECHALMSCCSILQCYNEISVKASSRGDIMPNILLRDGEFPGRTIDCCQLDVVIKAAFQGI